MTISSPILDGATAASESESGEYEKMRLIQIDHAAACKVLRQRADRWMVLCAGLLATAFFVGAFAAEPDQAPKRVVKPRSDPAFPLKQPRFPSESRMLGHDGIVSLLVLVGVDGSVLDQRAIVSTGHPELDAAALEITKTWRFRPGTVNGVPTKMWGNFSITFSVEGKPKPTENEQHRAAAKRIKEFDEQMEAAAESAAAQSEQVPQQTEAPEQR